jgi:hypothetical protein
LTHIAAMEGVSLCVRMKNYQRSNPAQLCEI